MLRKRGSRAGCGSRAAQGAFKHTLAPTQAVLKAGRMVLPLTQVRGATRRRDCGAAAQHQKGLPSLQWKVGVGGGTAS